MKVLAINGSPHMDEGNTAMILNPFLEGMTEAGSEVEVFYTRKLKIGPCNGDLSCWFKILEFAARRMTCRCFCPR